MSATTATLRGRVAAEANMLDTCTVRRKTGESVNDTTGVVTPTYSVVYSGKCKLQRSPVAGDQRRTVGEASVVVAAVSLHLPIVGSEAVATEDVATIDTAALDAALPGKVFRISGPADGSFKTARRLPVIEVAS
jgi:hypothetical protein